MKELRDLYDENLNKTGLTYQKGETIKEGYYPMDYNSSEKLWRSFYL